MFRNLFEWKRLVRNSPHQRVRHSYGVDLEGMSEFRGELFPQVGSACWVDQPSAVLRVDRLLAAKRVSPFEAELCYQFIVNGYCIVPGLIEPEKLDSVWAAYERALETGLVSVNQESHGEGDPYPGRMLDPHKNLPVIRTIQWDPRILRITTMLFDRATLPFQTIIGHKGSQQAPHSDAIHMTTYPLGFLIACWIPFEDVHPDSGPLVYYPKSHRLLPYLLSNDVGIPPLAFKEQGYRVYSEIYEPVVQRHLDMHNLQGQLFCPKKGDVLFWHSNLVHGGASRNDFQFSRKALVCHYFADGVFTYHDLSGNITSLHANGVHAPPVLYRPT